MLLVSVFAPACVRDVVLRRTASPPTRAAAAREGNDSPPTAVVGVHQGNDVVGLLGLFGEQQNGIGLSLGADSCVEAKHICADPVPAACSGEDQGEYNEASREHGDLLLANRPTA